MHDLYRQRRTKMSQFPNNSIDYSLTFYVMYVCIHLLKMGFRLGNVQEVNF